MRARIGVARRTRAAMALMLEEGGRVAHLKNILITGRPGVGKTTAIMETLKLLQCEACGFYTREIRQQGTRVGFEISDLAANAAVMAHVDFPKTVSVGKYGVDTEAVEKIGVSALQTALKRHCLAVVDEVGRMELSCQRFIEVLMGVLDADIPVLGTIHAKEDTVTRKIRVRNDTELWQITTANRGDLPARLAGAVRQILQF